jgi:hypothetical protein
MDLNEFMRKSLNLVDKQDVEREFNEAELKYAAVIANKDMEINEFNRKIESIDKRIKEIIDNIDALRNDLKTVTDTLNDIED